MSLCNLFGWFDPCGRQAQIANLNSVIATKDNDLATMQDEIIRLKADIEKLKNLEPVPTPEPETDPLQEQRDFWNSKYPKAYITYKGRYAPMSTTIRTEIPVQLFVTPKDPDIITDVINNNLLVSDPANCDDTILKIYKHTRTKPSNPYRYVYDQENVGVPEFWFFPHELRFAKAGDCDDWGNELASYLIAAGVPRFRVRCVAGECWGGGGHLTVYVLQDDMKTWRHINSTTPISYIENKTSLDQFPTSNDENDSIGIKDVWFSYNDDYAWHEFETAAAEKSYNKFKALFDIVPWDRKLKNGINNRKMNKNP